MVKATVWQTVKVLDTRSRQKFFLACAIQIILAIIDTIGVLLVGIMVAIATSFNGNSSVPYVIRFLEMSGLDNHRLPIERKAEA